MHICTHPEASAQLLIKLTSFLHLARTMNAWLMRCLQSKDVASVHGVEVVTEQSEELFRSGNCWHHNALHM